MSETGAVITSLFEIIWFPVVSSRKPKRLVNWNQILNRLHYFLYLPNEHKYLVRAYLKPNVLIIMFVHARRELTSCTNTVRSEFRELETGGVNFCLCLDIRQTGLVRPKRCMLSACVCKRLTLSRHVVYYWLRNVGGHYHGSMRTSSGLGNGAGARLCIF